MHCMTFIALVPLLSCCKRESVCLSVFLSKRASAFLKRMQVALAFKGENCHCTPTTKPKGNFENGRWCCFNGVRLFIEEVPLTLRNVCVCSVCSARMRLVKKSRIVPFCDGCFELEGGAPAKKKNLHSLHFCHSWLRPGVLGREITPAFSHCKLSLLYLSCAFCVWCWDLEDQVLNEWTARQPVVRFCLQAQLSLVSHTHNR